jgi:hypothetical protein
VSKAIGHGPIPIGEQRGMLFFQNPSIAGQIVVVKLSLGRNLRYHHGPQSDGLVQHHESYTTQVMHSLTRKLCPAGRDGVSSCGDRKRRDVFNGPRI